MKIPFLAWVFQGIPECMGIAALLLSLDSKPLNWRIVGAIGIAQAVVAYILRSMPLTPGVHIFILPISMALLMSKIARVRLDKALIYAVTVSVLIAVWEIIFHFALGFLGIIDLPYNNSNSLLRIMLGIPQVSLLFVFAFLLAKRKVNHKFLVKKLFVLHHK